MPILTERELRIATKGVSDSTNIEARIIHKKLMEFQESITDGNHIEMINKFIP